MAHGIVGDAAVSYMHFGNFDVAKLIKQQPAPEILDDPNSENMGIDRYPHRYTYTRKTAWAGGAGMQGK